MGSHSGGLNAPNSDHTSAKIGPSYLGPSPVYDCQSSRAFRSRMGGWDSNLRPNMMRRRFRLYHALTTARSLHLPGVAGDPPDDCEFNPPPWTMPL